MRRRLRLVTAFTEGATGCLLTGIIKSIVKLLSPASQLPILMLEDFERDGSGKLGERQENVFIDILLLELQLHYKLMQIYNKHLSTITDKGFNALFDEGSSSRIKLSNFIRSKRQIDDGEVNLLSIRLHRHGILTRNYVDFIEYHNLVHLSENADYYSEADYTSLVKIMGEGDHEKSCIIRIEGKELNLTDYDSPTLFHRIIREERQARIDKEKAEQEEFVEASRLMKTSIVTANSRIGPFDQSTDFMNFKKEVSDNSANNSKLDNLSFDDNASNINPKLVSEMTIVRDVEPVSTNQLVKTDLPLKKGKVPTNLPIKKNNALPIFKKELKSRLDGVISKRKTIKQTKPMNKSERSVTPKGRKSVSKVNQTAKSRRSVVKNNVSSRSVNTGKKPSISTRNIGNNRVSVKNVSKKQISTKTPTKSRKSIMTPQHGKSKRSLSFLKNKPLKKQASPKRNINAGRRTTYAVPKMKSGKNVGNKEVINKKYRINAQDAINHKKEVQKKVFGNKKQLITKIKQVIKKEIQPSNNLPLRSKKNMGNERKALKSKRRKKDKQAMKRSKKLLNRKFETMNEEEELDFEDDPEEYGDEDDYSNQTIMSEDEADASVTSEMELIDRKFGNGGYLKDIIKSCRTDYGDYKGYRKVPYTDKLIVKGVLLNVLDNIIKNKLPAKSSKLVTKTEKKENMNIMNIRQKDAINDDTKIKRRTRSMMVPNSGLKQFNLRNSFLKEFMMDKKEEPIIKEKETEKIVKCYSTLIQKKEPVTRTADSSFSFVIYDNTDKIRKNIKTSQDISIFTKKSENNKLELTPNDLLNSAEQRKLSQYQYFKQDDITVNTDINFHKLNSPTKNLEISTNRYNLKRDTSPLKLTPTHSTASFITDKSTQLKNILKRIIIYTSKLEELKNDIYKANPSFNLVRLFNYYDSNKKGELSEDEFINILFDINLKIEDIKIKRILLYLNGIDAVYKDNNSITFSQFLKLLYPIRRDDEYLRDKFWESRKDFVTSSESDLRDIMSETDIYNIKQVIKLIVKKLEDIARVIRRFNEINAEELFNVIVAGNGEYLTWDMLKEYLLENKIRFIESDLDFIFRDFTGEDCLKMKCEHFDAYFNQELWTINSNN